MTPVSEADRTLLERIENRVLWLAVQQIHYANRIRPRNDPLKVGGHQASCASVVTLMTMLFFRYMNAGDLLAVKPHASPVFHAIQYLLGNLDGSHLKQLRQLGGLQAYPSRRRDPEPVDFSTGSVGLGAVAPNFAALTHTYLRTHEFEREPYSRRFISLVGDAELDEGSIWEAIAEPAMANSAQVLWLVDLNRQSLDRIIPGIRARSWREMFAANNWNVIDAKYGRQLQAAFDEPNGELLRICIDELSNEAYQRLLRLPPSELRHWLPKMSRYPHELGRLLDRWNDARLHDVFWNLGGHDIDVLQAALDKASQSSGPAVILAYTLKGWKLPSVGHPQNHSVLLTNPQMDKLRDDLEIKPDEVWAQFAAGTPESDCCFEVAERLKVERPHLDVIRAPEIPSEASVPLTGMRSTQQSFGTILSTLSRDCPEVAQSIVTVSPDVASSTNLGGWINRHQVWQLGEAEELPDDQQAGILQWTGSPQGQHIELGISENNLFLMLGQLGLSQELFGELLLPIGTLYDPFIRRGLDALFYSLYSGAKFIVVGTPSGITLASEGGIHQSILTPSIGAEMPELAMYEPCFAQELNWILMDAIRRLRRRESSTYLRLTTRQVDQELFPSVKDPAAREQLRRQVLAGAYRLRDYSTDSSYAPGDNVVHLFASGAILPEVLSAQDTLLQRGIFANVFNVTGPGPLYDSYQRASHDSLRRTSVSDGIGEDSHSNWLEELVAVDERCAPIVTVTDAHPHSLAWIGSALGAKVQPLGVVDFGQSGDLHDVYHAARIDADSITDACLAAIRGRP